MRPLPISIASCTAGASPPPRSPTACRNTRLACRSSSCSTTTLRRAIPSCAGFWAEHIEGRLQSVRHDVAIRCCLIASILSVSIFSLPGSWLSTGSTAGFGSCPKVAVAPVCRSRGGWAQGPRRGRRADAPRALLSARSCGDGSTALPSIVGHDPAHGDALAGAPDHGPGEEAGAGVAGLVVQDLDIGGPGMVVDADMDILEADLAVLTIRLPVTGGMTLGRCPGLSKRANFLMSRWTRSPGRRRSAPDRAFGLRAASWPRPRRVSSAATVERASPSRLAILAAVSRQCRSRRLFRALRGRASPQCRGRVHRIAVPLG